MHHVLVHGELTWTCNLSWIIYACAVCIVSYLPKAPKGMSQPFRKACDEAKKGKSNIKQQVYLVLQLPMKKSSRQVVFIHTAPPDERVEL